MHSVSVCCCGGDINVYICWIFFSRTLSVSEESLEYCQCHVSFLVSDM